MNRKNATLIGLGLIAASTVTLYAAEEARIRILQKQLAKSTALGMWTTRMLKLAVEGMTEDQAGDWLKNLRTHIEFEEIIENQ